MLQQNCIFLCQLKSDPYSVLKNNRTFPHASGPSFICCIPASALHWSTQCGMKGSAGRTRTEFHRFSPLHPGPGKRILPSALPPLARMGSHLLPALWQSQNPALKKATRRRDVKTTAYFVFSFYNVKCWIWEKSQLLLQGTRQLYYTEYGKETNSSLFIPSQHQSRLKNWFILLWDHFTALRIFNFF